jgi:hypothetical protein
VRTDQKLPGALITGGGSARAGGGDGGSQGVKYAPMPPGMYENGQKNWWFPALFGNTLFFAQKYLNKM